MGTIQNFHYREDFEKSLNTAYIALIPENHGAKKIERFQTDQFDWKWLQADYRNSYREAKKGDAKVGKHSTNGLSKKKTDY